MIIRILVITNTNKQLSFKITYESAKKIINKMKEKFGGSSLFGKEKDKSFKGNWSNIPNFW